ncbi:hypothetical protein OQJ26_00685 [Legionella sp. PATHC038]|uniref:hypothetical protein n=1 Tax=Legionella sheltonii TaxID=2992041 RepID=UPI00224301BD|nr:hypothetical protein [Legionella sp. PATHC038]MCW8397309.1 hypothetical protein [Legionella sp. PATHC038]
MKLSKTTRIYNERELLDLFEKIHRDALCKDLEDFTKKYDPFEFPEQLIQFNFGHGETILHKLMKAVSELLARKNSIDFFEAKLARLLYFFEFLIKHGADINSTFRMKIGITPLTYLLTSPFLEDSSPFFKIIDKYKPTINSETFAVMIDEVAFNEHVDNFTRACLIDKFISWGAEITRDHEFVHNNSNFFQENLHRWKHDALLRKQEILREKVTEHERTIEDLRQKNRLIEEQLSQLIKKVDSLLNSSETLKIDPETSRASFSFFVNNSNN